MGLWWMLYHAGVWWKISYAGLDGVVVDAISCRGLVENKLCRVGWGCGGRCIMQGFGGKSMMRG